MPAKSMAQRRYFGMLAAEPEKRRAAGIEESTVQEFARTKEKGLPEHVAKKKRKYYKQSQ